MRSIILQYVLGSALMFNALVLIHLGDFLWASFAALASVLILGSVLRRLL